MIDRSESIASAAERDREPSSGATVAPRSVELAGSGTPTRHTGEADRRGTLAGMRIVVRACVCFLAFAALPACSLERRPLTVVAAVDAGPLDAGPMPDAPDAPVPLDVPPPMDVLMDVPLDVPLDVPVLVDAPDAPPLDVPPPVDAPDAPPRVDAPDAPVPLDGGCTPGTTRCDPGEVLARCVGGSFVPSPSPCSLGCSTTPMAHCRQLVPANVSAAVATATSVGPVVIASNQQIDTTACTVMPLGLAGVRVTQDAGGTVCLLYVDSLSVTASGYLFATGNVPLVIVSRSSVTVSGTIDVSSYSNEPDGMGGFFTRTGAGAGTGGAVGGNGLHSTMGSQFGDGGGGGGAFCGDGGDGADGSENSAPGLGATGGVVMLMPLAGGASGGIGSGGMRGGGGAGGGAFQLSVMGTLVIDGAILAGGAGGFGGDADAFAATSGGGGGSGGGLFIEAEVISLGAVALVGAPGAGGASGSCGSTPGRDGQNGALVMGQPAGGATPCGTAGPGAPGAGNTIIVGGDAVATGNNGAGGGGGAGCIHFRSRAGTAPGSGTVNPRTTTSVVTTSTIISM